MKIRLLPPPRGESRIFIFHWRGLAFFLLVDEFLLFLVLALLVIFVFIVQVIVIIVLAGEGRLPWQLALLLGHVLKGYVALLEFGGHGPLALRERAPALMVSAMVTESTVP